MNFSPKAQKLLYIIIFLFFQSITAQIVINEISINPNTENALVNCASPTQGMEWIELYNTSPCTTVDLGCYFLGANTGTTNNGTFIFLEGTTIEPLDFLVIGGINAPNVDIVLTNYCNTPNYCGTQVWHLGDTDGWLGLYQSNGTVEDAVFWTENAGEAGKPFSGAPLDEAYNNALCLPGGSCQGATNLPNATAMDISQSEITYIGENPNIGQIIHRIEDGDETWEIATTATGGSCNNVCVTDPPTMTIDFEAITEPACGVENGSATTTVQNGQPPYVVSWSSGQTDLAANDLASGDYTVSVTDANGCMATNMVTIPPSGALIPVSVVTDVSCLGGSDGTVTITDVTGGSGTYTYDWSPLSDNDNAIDNLEAGTYTVTINDPAGGMATVYEEDFDGAQTWTLNVSSGTNEADANFFTIDDAEGGVEPPNCGVGNNGDNTLYISNTLIPGGASYNAGGFCDLGIFCVTANQRAESPDISTIGFTGMTLTFDYIGDGEGMDDNASFLYSIDGGASWTTLEASLKSNTCGNGQGEWTAATYALPAECEGLANFKIAFNWTNDDDGVGTDPSFAANNVLITSGGGGSCPAIVNVVVNAPETIVMTGNSTPENCGQSNGTVEVTASGGAGNYTYELIGGTTNMTGIFTGLTTGSYTFNVMDGEGCTGSPVTINVGTISNQDCDDNDCTTLDAFDPATCSCLNDPIDLPPCDDGLCTTDDLYDAATCECTHTLIDPPICDDGDCSNGLEIYNEATCMCEGGIPVTPPNAPTITGDTEICEEGDFMYTIANDPNVTAYTWTVTGGTINSGGSANDEFVDVDWTDMAIGEVCVEATNGCETTQPICLSIVLNSALTPPNINCNTTGLDMVSITWDVVDGSTGYIITYDINNGTAQTENTTDTNFMVDALNMGDEANFTVVAQSGGVCLDSAPSNTISCVAQDCPTLNFSLNLPEMLCNNDTTIDLITATLFDIEITVGGDVYLTIEGAGVTNGIFNAADVTIGTPQNIQFTIEDTNSDCLYTANHDITIGEQPTADAGADQVLEQGTTLMLDGSNSTTNETYDYVWTTTDGNITANNTSLNPTIDAAGVYQITVTTQEGCTDQDEVTITTTEIEEEEDDDDLLWAFIPSAFSPNGDGLNEPLGVLGTGIESIEWRIYNRWGEMVFESRSLDIEWDGTHKNEPAPIGVYVYYAKITYITAETEDLKGTVTLVR